MQQHLGDGGQAQEAQREFLVLLEDTIRMPDILKGVHRYQMAVDKAKVRLDLAVALGTWLMPSRIVLNTGSVVGYNNQLKEASPGMNLRINNDVNRAQKNHLMAGGPSKVNAPNSHPSNPIHKAQSKSSGALPHTPARSATKPHPTITPKKDTTEPDGSVAGPQANEPTPPTGSGNEAHDANKVIIAV